MNLILGDVKLRIPKENKVMRGNITREKIKSEDRLLIRFGYNEKLKDEIKAMDGAKWHAYDEDNPRKIWSVKDNQRNQFQLAYLTGLNPYQQYDIPLIEFQPNREKNYIHQRMMTAHWLTRHWAIIAGEMGTGKTLAAIEGLEYLARIMAIGTPYWVGPKSALSAVRYEFRKWNSLVYPRFMTYEELKRIVENWSDTDVPPLILICDECSRIKNYTAQRSQAARIIADAMRQVHGDRSYGLLMSGTPAPKDPADWYNICEVACPGYLKEGNVEKFKRRLALIEQYDAPTGGSFPKLVTWWDDQNKCGKCGRLESDPDHDPINMTEKFYHPFRRSVNEIEYLYERMKGLVLVKFKSECLDLPEKIYRRIKCPARPDVLRTADLIKKTASSAIKAATLCRELSDGFQYTQVESGTQTCGECKGRLKIKMQVDEDDPNNPLDAESLARGRRAIFENDENGKWNLIGFSDKLLRIVEREVDCETCRGTGQVKAYERRAVRVECSKDDALIDLLDQYQDEGRVVIWAGFTDSVDRCVETCLKQGWPVIRLDGRGWYCNIKSFSSSAQGDFGVELLEMFDNKKDYPKIAWVGQPGAGGMGLNLTASSMEVYYSNTFKGEDRWQSEDRIHRPGADHNRGCTIYDLIHLPTDIWVLDNLFMKRDLQNITMGMFRETMERIEKEFDRERIA